MVQIIQTVIDDCTPVVCLMAHGLPLDTTLHDQLRCPPHSVDPPCRCYVVDREEEKKHEEKKL